MRQNLVDERVSEVLKKIAYLVGCEDTILNISSVPARVPFDDEFVDFLNSLSKSLMKMPEAKAFPDVITLGFWIRKSSILDLKNRFIKQTEDIKVGRGVAFHIAPSNVPVNYAYSLVMGLLTGNANIVRIPSKDFQQVSIINRAVAETLAMYPKVAPYVCLIKYDRDQSVNDYLSAISDTRVVWGGDSTIAELRKSPLGARASEITFADRYSLAIIDSEVYLGIADKKRFAEAFYNDTFLTDQNACTSPRVVVWLGKSRSKAKAEFWKYEHELVKEKYTLQPIMGINKLTSSYLAAVAMQDVKIIPMEDNYIVRVQVPNVDPYLMELKDNSGYFFEYDCDDIMEIRELCNNVHCQTIGYLGEKKDIFPLLMSGVKGVDRVVPIGTTMDFDFIWDGYNLVERLTRTIKINV